MQDLRIDKGAPPAWHVWPASISRATSASSGADVHLRDRAQPRRQALAATGVSPDTRVRDLDDAELVRLRDWIDGNYRIEGDLRREIASDIRRKVEIACYQGLRHRRGLPVHGQRTHTNARTRKGPRRAIAGKKKAGRK